MDRPHATSPTTIHGTGLADEVRAMQNPALGAALVWRFACGFSPPTSPLATPLPLMYVVLPMLYHSQTAQQIAATRTGSGLRKLEEKFWGSSDILLLLQPRALAMRDLTLRSLRIAMRSGLLTLVPVEAALWPRLEVRMPPQEGAVAGLLKSAEKLGHWCSSLTLYEVSGVLKLEL